MQTIIGYNWLRLQISLWDLSIFDDENPSPKSDFGGRNFFQKEGALDELIQCFEERAHEDDQLMS